MKFKNILLIFLILFSFNGYSNQLEFECKSKKNDYKISFSETNIPNEFTLKIEATTRLIIFYISYCDETTTVYNEVVSITSHEAVDIDQLKEEAWANNQELLVGESLSQNLQFSIASGLTHIGPSPFNFDWRSKFQFNFHDTDEPVKVEECRLKRD